ncbi:MAG: glycosyltransferase family 4 protein [Kineosporiaceae bacterium]
MRILHLLATSGGGVVRHVADVAGGQGPDVRVAGPPATLRALAEVVGPGGPDTEVVDLGARPGATDARALWRLAALVRRHDVVHAHGVRAGAAAVLARRLDAVLHPRRARAGIVVTVHNGPPDGRGAARVFALLEAVCARGCDDVLVVSGDLGERMLRAGARRVERALVPAPAPRAQVPPSGGAPVGDAAVPQEAGGVDPAVPAEVPGRSEGPRVLASAVRLAPQKAPHLLVDVVAGLHAQGRAVRGVVAGEGPLLADLGARARALRAPVDFLGLVSDVPALFAAADVVLLTSRWEGQPLVLQEALRAGAAIVATDVGGVGEVCGDAAVLVPWPPGTSDARLVPELVAAVGRVLDDADLRGRLRAAALGRAALLPTRADALAQLARVYADVTARGQIGGRGRSRDLPAADSLEARGQSHP